MEAWRQIQRKNFRDWETFTAFLEIEGNTSPYTPKHFPLNIPLRLAEKIEKGNPNDPILLQFLPSLEEQKLSPYFLSDPVQDVSFQKTNRLLHKYTGRALLVATGACVMNCRFCFRQNYPYEKGDNFDEEIKVIEQDPTLYEIILSGGDPLSLGDEKLGHLIERLSAIPHLKLLRFHTRFPLGIPERITDQFLRIVETSRLQTVFILHTNHFRELDAAVLEALKKIQRLGIPVLTQTVLLKNINDDAAVLKKLFLDLASAGIIPYYLHQLDRVQGAAHFEVEIERGKELVEELRASLPGYALPTYVQEVPGKWNKTPITS